jgi:peroxiredoxin
MNPTAGTLSRSLRPGDATPELQLTVVGGKRWSLASQTDYSFLLLVFYRGHFCPVCRRYLKDLAGHRADWEDLGVAVVLASADSEERAAMSRSEWGLEAFTLGYGLEEAQMQGWGLYASRGTPPSDQPSVISEPGLFLIRPDRTLFYVALNSGPVGRPAWPDLIRFLRLIRDERPDYPVRGGYFARA